MRNVMCVVGIVVLCLCVAGCATKDARLQQEGYEAMCEGKDAEAAKFLQEALKVNPENPLAIYNLGVVYARTGKKAEAKAMYEKLIALNPDTTAGVTEKGEGEGKKLVDMARDNLKRLEASK